ncbi:MAG: hypothetical protein WBB73_15250 [Candidatus Aminicenantaceae bacterium]
MTHDFSAQGRKIVDNYLDRLRGHLKALPEADRDELVREIYSHIYESYATDSTKDDIQRILNVLDRLGEPSEVVASRLSGSMKRMGRKRNLPFYILAGIFIGLFGLPLGAGGLALLIGLGITLVALIFTYYMTAGVLVLGGWLTWVVTTIRLFYPDFLLDQFHTLDQFVDSPLSVILNFAAGAVCILMGLGMFWLGRHILSGARFLFSQTGATIKNLRHRRHSMWRTSRTRQESVSPGITKDQTE